MILSKQTLYYTLLLFRIWLINGGMENWFMQSKVLVWIGVVRWGVRKTRQINLVEDTILSKNHPSKCKLTKQVSRIQFPLILTSKLFLERSGQYFLMKWVFETTYFCNFCVASQVTLKVSLFIAIFFAVSKTKAYVFSYSVAGAINILSFCHN